jgi:hypothetical protein
MYGRFKSSTKKINFFPGGGPNTFPDRFSIGFSSSTWRGREGRVCV